MTKEAGAPFLALAARWLLITAALGAAAGLARFGDGRLGLLNHDALISMHLQSGHLGWVLPAILGLLLLLLQQPSAGVADPVPASRPLSYLYRIGLAGLLLAIAAGWAAPWRYAEIPVPLSLFFALLLGWFLFHLGRTVLRRYSQEIAFYYFLLALSYILFYLLVLLLPLRGLYWEIGVNIGTHFLFDGMMLTIMGLSVYLLPRLTGRRLYSEMLAIIHLWMAVMMVFFAASRHLVRLGLPPQLEFWAFFYNLLMVGLIVLYFYNLYLTVRGAGLPLPGRERLTYYYLLASNGYLALIAFQGLGFLYSHIYLGAPVPKMIVVAHAHLALFGFVSLGLMGGILFFWPRLSRLPAPGRIQGVWILATASAALFWSVLSTWWENTGIAYAHSDVPLVRTFNEYIAMQYVGDLLLLLAILPFACHLLRGLANPPFSTGDSLRVAAKE